MGLWERFGQSFQNTKPASKIPTGPANNANCAQAADRGSDAEADRQRLASLDLSRVSARRFMGEDEDASLSAPEPGTASISLPADNRPPGEPSTHGEPQGDMLKELLLPFQPWPVALALDAAGQIRIKASRLLLPQMQAYCEQHGPELQAFLESCPGHTWSTMKNQNEVTDVFDKT